jgi:hypothetical protein
MAGTATACTAAVLFLCGKLLQPGLELYVPQAAGFLLGGIYSFMAILIMLYVLLWFCTYADTFKGRRFQFVLRAYLRALFPVVKLQGQMLGKREALCQAYIQFLNHLFLRRHLRYPPERILLLAPHCLQWDQCPHKITRNIANCHQCGHCPIGAIVDMTRQLGMPFAVATGGTLARQIVKDIRPKAVVAIACERDLVSGMQDIAPMPVLGLLNERPNGPCFNTSVDLTALQKVLQLIIGD